MTKKQIENFAKQNSIDISLVSLRKCGGTWHFEMADVPADLAKKNIDYYFDNNDQLTEVVTMIKKYNRQVKKLLNAMGFKYWGFKTGTGAWDYQLGSMSESTKLAFANID